VIAANNALFDYCNRVTANFAMALYLPFGQVNISDSGFHVVHDSTQQIASQSRTDDLLESFLQAGYEAVDELLKFLEENKDDYEAWKTSSAFTMNRQFFVLGTEDFQQYYDIGGSRRVFVALWPIIRRVEEYYIKPILGATTYEDYKEALRTTGYAALSDSMKFVVDLVRPAVVFLTMSEALADLPLQVRPDGVVSFETRTNTDNSREKKTADATLLAAKRQRAEQIGRDHLKRLSLWVATGNPEPTGSGVLFTNAQENKYYGAF
jgi:hypothetical protein